MSIADRLREEREGRGLTQAALAEHVGASKRTVQHWESGQSGPTAGDLAQMALLGIDVRYLVTGQRDYAAPEPLTQDEQALLAHWRNASREARAAAMGALLGAGLRPSQVEQVFHGRVGQVFTGDVSGSRVEIHESRGNYPPPNSPRKPRKG